MTTANNVFIGIVVFYSVFIALIGLVPQSEIEFGDNDDLDNPLENVPLLGNLLEFWNTIFVTVTGFPAIIQAIFFAPMTGFAIYWVVRFFGWLLPFIGV